MPIRRRLVVVARQDTIRVSVTRILALLFFALLVLRLAPPVMNPGHLGADLAGQVSVSASVPPNPYNMVAKQLAEKDTKLSEKERALAAQERLLLERGEVGTSSRDQTFTTLIILIGSSLFWLIALNFYLDYRRRITAIPTGALS